MILDLLDQLGGEVLIEDKIRCKTSPHQPSEVFTGLMTKETDFSKYSNQMKQTIIQRLKLLIYLKNESSKNQPT